MRLTPFLTPAQVQHIHRTALRVLDEVGVKVEHDQVRHLLTAVGGRTAGADVVRFAPKDVEHALSLSPRRPAESPQTPHIRGSVGVYECRYLDPASNRPIPFTEDLFARYIALAKSLPNVARVHAIGIPFRDPAIPAACMPLAEKLYAWKYGIEQDGSVIDSRLCQPLLDLFAVHAAYAGRRVEEVFKAVGYMLSPLRLARFECEQLLFFRRHRLRMWIGHMPIQGATAPVSFAGATVLALAEQLFLYLLTRALWGEATLSLDACVPVLDMRSLAACYGRPEEQRINAAFACLADFYGCQVSGHTGGTDAKVPSVQAGAQKVLGPLFTALATGHGQVSVGMLSMDELCSPVQMVLDDDIVRALNLLLSNAGLDEVDCAFEEIRSAGHGGDHVGTDYTARRFRECLLQPRTWSSGLLNQWTRAGATTDIDTARQIVADFNSNFQPSYFMSAAEERDLRQVIRRAAMT